MSDNTIAYNYLERYEPRGRQPQIRHCRGKKCWQLIVIKKMHVCKSSDGNKHLMVLDNDM